MELICAALGAFAQRVLRLRTMRPIGSIAMWYILPAMDYIRCSARITITPKTAIITKPSGSLWSEVWRIAYSYSAYSGSWSMRRRSKSSLRTLPFDSPAGYTTLAWIDQAQRAIIMPESQQINASFGQ
jgi:hypothetical protein